DAKVVVRPPTDHTRFCTLIFGSHGAAKSRSSLHHLCPTSRDFVPWRFSDAGRISAWRVTSCRRPRNLHKRRHYAVQQKTSLFDHLVGGGEKRRVGVCADHFLGAHGPIACALHSSFT